MRVFGVLVLVCDSERQSWPPGCSSALEKMPERLGAGGGWTLWLSSGGASPGRLQHTPASSPHLPGDAFFALLEVGCLGPVRIEVSGVSLWWAGHFSGPLPPGGPGPIIAELTRFVSWTL